MRMNKKKKERTFIFAMRKTRYNIANTIHGDYFYRL